MHDFIQAVINPEVPFIRMALFAGIIGSIPFGFIGSFVVVKKMSSIAGAISHSVLGGIGLALYLNAVVGVSFIQPMGGALIFALLASGILSLVMIYGSERMDTVIGAVWAVGMSLGLLFMARTPGYVDPMSYLFGNILLIGKSQLITISAFSVIILTFGILFYNQFQAISFDAEFAETRGINTTIFQVVIMLLISITVVLMVSLVGTVMVIAFLTLPPAMASMFSKRLSVMIGLSVIFSILLSSVGLCLSYIFDLPTGSVTIILAGAVYILLRLINSAVRKVFARQ
ncbi:MAG: metal ABC transporter permease [Spirochaetales bacterium]|nr:metal ABC transporter permease [Spirochaetales bacterium]